MNGRDIRQLQQILFLRWLLAYLLVLKYVQGLKDIHSYNAGNQLASTNEAAYSYDINANLIKKTSSEGTTTYSYDYENRLIKVVMPNGTVAEFKYDPFGRRVEKRVTENGISTTKRYFYDNEDILFEYDGNGNIGNRYIHGLGIDEPLAMIDGKNIYYYHADGLGSIVALTDSSQKVVQTYEYDSFGNLKDQKERIKQPYTFTAREWDKETKLYFNRARYRDPYSGLFITKDPIGFKGGMNLYQYAKGNPVLYSDPFGLKIINGMDCQESNRKQIPVISSNTPYKTYTTGWNWICTGIVIEDTLTCVCTCEKHETITEFYKMYTAYEVTYKCCRKNKFVTMKKTETEQLPDDIRYSQSATGVVRNILGTTTDAFGGCSCALEGVGKGCAY